MSFGFRDSICRRRRLNRYAIWCGSGGDGVWDVVGSSGWVSMASDMLWARLADGRWVRAVEVRSAPPASVHAARIDTATLSSVAFAILRQAPDEFRDGHPIPLRQWTELTGYRSPAHIRTGLRELSEVGLVHTVAYDGRRVQYAGEPSLMWSPSILGLAAS